MAEEVKARRRYDSPRRRRQAQETRDEILRAAQELFERDGFAATSMAAIAERAGVSLKTVYLHFETKPGLLRELWHGLLRGQQASVPVGEQPWFREVLDEPDPARQIRLNTRNSRIVKGRVAGLMAVIRGAAHVDPATAELWKRIQLEYHANQRAVVESLAEKGALAEALDVDVAADILWALNDPSLYSQLTAERGWSTERYEQWLGDLLCRELLRGGATRARAPRAARGSRSAGGR